MVCPMPGICPAVKVKHTGENYDFVFLISSWQLYRIRGLDRSVQSGGKFDKQTDMIMTSWVHTLYLKHVHDGAFAYLQYNHDSRLVQVAQQKYLKYCAYRSIDFTAAVYYCKELQYHHISLALQICSIMVYGNQSCSKPYTALQYTVYFYCSIVFPKPGSNGQLRLSIMLQDVTILQCGMTARQQMLQRWRTRSAFYGTLCY